MEDHTPETDDVRIEYSQHGSWITQQDGLDAFDRWLAAHDAKVRVVALEDAAQIAYSMFDDDNGSNSSDGPIAAAIRALKP